jgi:hypothetical protein
MHKEGCKSCPCHSLQYFTYIICTVYFTPKHLSNCQIYFAGNGKNRTEVALGKHIENKYTQQYTYQQNNKNPKSNGRSFIRVCVMYSNEYF